MHVDELFSINNPDGYFESATTVGRVAAYICSICGSFVGRDYLVAHVDFHNKIETMENEILVLNDRVVWKGNGEW